MAGVFSAGGNRREGKEHDNNRNNYGNGKRI